MSLVNISKYYFLFVESSENMQSGEDRTVERKNKYKKNVSIFEAHKLFLTGREKEHSVPTLQISEVYLY